MWDKKSVFKIYFKNKMLLETTFLVQKISYKLIHIRELDYFS